MTKEIRVVIIESGDKAIHVVEKFDCSLENLQEFVGGYVEAVRVNDSITIWVNEEGKMQGLEPNFYLTDEKGQPLDIVVGNALIAGTDSEGETVSLTEAELAEIKNRFLTRGQFNIQ